MKKLLITLFAILLLAGCSSSSDSAALVNNGDEVIFEYGDTKYTKQQLNTDMKKNDFSSIIIQDYMLYVAEKEGLDLTAHNTEIEESVKQMQESGSDALITYYYGSVDNYKKIALYYNVLNDFATNKVKENLDSYISEYKPYKAQYAFFDNKDAAEKLIKDVKAGGDFATLAKEAGYTQDASAQIYNDKSESVIIEIKEFVNNATATGLSDVITTSTTTTDANGNSVQTPRYYVVNLIDKDANNFKDELIAQLAAEIEETTIVNEAIAKYPLTIYDQATYEVLSAAYEGIK